MKLTRSIKNTSGDGITKTFTVENNVFHLVKTKIKEKPNASTNSKVDMWYIYNISP